MGWRKAAGCGAEVRRDESVADGLIGATRPADARAMPTYDTIPPRRLDRFIDRAVGRTTAEHGVRPHPRENAEPPHAARGCATLTQALQRFLERCEGEGRARRRAPATLAAYRQMAGHLTRVLETDGTGQDTQRPIAAFGRDDVRRYVRQRREEGAADLTVARELVPLRGALRLAAEERAWRGDLRAVFAGGVAPRARPRVRWPSRDSCERFTRELESGYVARIAFAIATSSTWRSVDYARKDDILEGGMVVRVRTTRRATRHRLVPIESAEQRELLRIALEGMARRGEMLFAPWPDARRDLWAACMRAGTAPYSPNDLGRALGGWMWGDGVPASVIARRMGLADARTVEWIYGPDRPTSPAPRVPAARPAADGRRAPAPRARKAMPSAKGGRRRGG